MKIAVLTLTKNEEKHVRRAIGSAASFADHHIIVDSGSIDATVAIAQDLGATVFHNNWINYATQFNWGLSKVPADVDWVLRLDADEIVSPELATEIADKLESITADVDGVYVARRMNFLATEVRRGGLFPIRVIRLFRNGRGRCENRWMDEHIIVDGVTAEFSGEIVDDNLNSITWWTEKHNWYASREVVDLLNLELGFMESETVANLRDGQQSGIKRWLKEEVYANFPTGTRAALYFLYRYIFRLGFLDTKEGRAFHVLQGFWYRYLVDTKLREVKTYMREHKVEPKVAIREVLGISLQE